MPASTPVSYISANSMNATSVVDRAAVLTGLQVYNVGSAVAYLKFWDKSSAPDPSDTSGTGTPKMRLLVPHNSGNGSGFIMPIDPDGIQFDNGIAFAIVTGAADTNETAVPANEIFVNIQYR